MSMKKSVTTASCLPSSSLHNSKKSPGQNRRSTSFLGTTSGKLTVRRMFAAERW